MVKNFFLSLSQSLRASKRKKIKIKNLPRLLQRNSTNLFIVIFLALVLHLPLYHTAYWRTNDAIEYINLARNIASGNGFIQNIKMSYFDTHPVITSAFHGRVSLISIFLAAIIFFDGDEYTMQLFSLLLGVVNACLVYFLARHFVKPQLALIAGLLAASNPNLLINSRLILSEPLIATWILLSFIVFFYFKESKLKYCLIGLFTALAYLTRAEWILFLPFFVLSAISSPKLIKTSVFLSTFLIVSLPYFLGNYLVNGTPFHSVHSRLYTVKSFHEAINGYGYEKTFPSPLEFVLHNWTWIIQEELRLFGLTLSTLLEFDFFGPFLFLLLALTAKRLWKKFKLFYIGAAIIYLVYLSGWSGMFETSRHYTITFLLLLPPLVYSLQKLTKPILLFFLLTIAIAYAVFDVHRIVWARTVDPTIDIWSQPVKKPVYTWINSHTATDDIISSTGPEMIYLHTNRPSIRTIKNLEKNYEKFIKEYSINYLLVEDTAYRFLNKSANPVVCFPDSIMYRVKNSEFN